MLNTLEIKFTSDNYCVYLGNSSWKIYENMVTTFDWFKVSLAYQFDHRQYINANR